VHDRPRVWLLVVLLALPLAGLVLLLAVPGIDVEWEHHPSHFLLVLAVALINVALALVASEAAHQRADARLVLVSLALITSSGFLALHALATPDVLLDHPNSGFVVATPVGLLLASGFAAASAVELGRAPGDGAPAASNADPRRSRAPVDRLGDRVAHGGAVPRPSPRGGGAARVPPARADRDRAVHVRRGALPEDLPDPRSDAPTVGRGRLPPARRGAGRRRVRAELARVVVGVARPDGGRVRDRHRVGPQRVPPRGLGDRRVRRVVPGADARAHRPARPGRSPN